MGSGEFDQVTIKDPVSNKESILLRKEANISLVVMEMMVMSSFSQKMDAREMWERISFLRFA